MRATRTSLIPASRTKRAIAEILRDEGFIETFEEVKDGAQPRSSITLKYVGKVPVISGLKRVSKPGLRVYATEDGHPARARRPRRCHRQHQPRHHDRLARPPGVSLAAKCSPTSGRSICHASAGLPFPFPAASTSKSRAITSLLKAPRVSSSATSRRRCASFARTVSCVVERPSDEKRYTELHGLSRTLLANMVIGVTSGFRKGLEITGVGYRAQLVGTKLQLNLGYSHPIEIDPPSGVSFELENPTRWPLSASTRSSSATLRRASEPPASQSPTRAKASATPVSRSGARRARRARSEARSEHGHGQDSRCAPEATRPHSPDPCRVDAAAAPGDLPQPQPDLRPGHRRQRRQDACRGILARVRCAHLEGHQVGAGQGGRPAARRACPAAGVERVVFDRAGFRYHGRVRALADAAREGGLDF